MISFEYFTFVCKRTEWNLFVDWNSNTRINSYLEMNSPRDKCLYMHKNKRIQIFAIWNDGGVPLKVQYCLSNSQNVDNSFHEQTTIWFDCICSARTAHLITNVWISTHFSRHLCRSIGIPSYLSFFIYLSGTLHSIENCTLEGSNMKIEPFVSQQNWNWQQLHNDRYVTCNTRGRLVLLSILQ